MVKLNGPSGLAFDADDNVWIVNSINSRIQKFTRDGKFLGGFGQKGSGEGELDMPWGITLDDDGNIYVADWNNHRVQKFTTGGDHLLTFGSGKRTGISPDGGTPYSHSYQAHVAVNPKDLNHPTGVAVDGEGDVYVVDWMNERVVIFDKDADAVATLRGDASGLVELCRPYVARLIEGSQAEDWEGKLELLASEEGAVVYLDDAEVGASPLPIQSALAIGKHRLRVSKDGYLPYEGDLVVN